VPEWLKQRLVHTAGIDPGAVNEMAGAEAMDLWERHITGQG
jgi:hypothetical protein